MATGSVSSTSSTFWNCCLQSADSRHETQTEITPKKAEGPTLQARMAQLQRRLEPCCLNEPHAGFVQLPIELADELLTPGGRVDVDRCRALRQGYLLTQNLLPEHPNSALIHRVLKHLETDAAFRERLEQVDATLHPRSDIIVRATLGLRPDAELSARQVRQVLLSALLSEVRQGAVGNCFGAAICIQKQHNDLGQVMSDLIDLLRCGALTRQVGWEMVSFPFLLKSTSDCLKWAGCPGIGLFGVAPSHLKVCPVYQRLADAAGLKQAQVSELITKAARSPLWLAYREDYAPRLDRVVRKLAELPEAAASAERVYERVRTAFDALAEHPLLSAWQNSVAGMAEHGPDGLCMTELSRWFLRFLDHHGIAGLPAYDLLTRLQQRVRYVFDPAFSHFPEPLNSNYESGWVLYDTGQSAELDQWKPVDTPQRFRILIESVLSGAGLESLNASIRQMSCEQFFGQLHYIWGDEAPQDLAKDYHQLKHALWVDFRGNSTCAVWKAYHNQAKAPEQASLQAADGTTLLTALSEELRSLPAKTARLCRQNSAYLLSLGNDEHAFSLLAGRRELSDLAQALDPEYWAWRHIVKPALHIADRPPSKATRSKIISAVRSKLIADCNKFDADLKKLSSRKLSLYALGQLLICLVRDYGTQESKAEDVERIVLEHLPTAENSLIRSCAVPFADLNYRADWTSNKHQWLAFAFNPVKRDVDVLRYVRDEAIQSSSWLSGGPWKLITAS